MSQPVWLRIEGARQNNLKNVSVDIPHDRVTVITGVSGSGKSSLAFDTLFAEGQWRYIESLSTYARMFLERLDRPDVDRIEHIRPAIALEQKNPVRTARSTVGTATERTNAGSVSEPPSAGSRLHWVNPFPPAQPASNASPRITPVSWQLRPEGSKRRKLAPAGLASGTSTISIPGHRPLEALL